MNGERWLTLTVPHTYKRGDEMLLPHYDFDERLFVVEVQGQRLLVRAWTWRDSWARWRRVHPFA